MPYRAIKANLAAVAMLAGCATGERADMTAAGLCAGSEFRAFDFWLGEWSIEQRILAADGTWTALPASTKVTSSPDGCVLTENWSGDVQFFWEEMTAPQRIWGYSVRRFDPKAKSWAIYWMDSRNPAFDTPHVGGFNGARGEFFRDFDAPDGPRRSRISFEQRAPGDVLWELAVSADGGATFAPIWVMEMRRGASR